MATVTKLRHPIVQRSRGVAFRVFTLLSLSAALAFMTPARAQTGEQEASATPACVLKTDPQECAVRADEQLRTVPANSATEFTIAYGERHLYSFTLSQGQFLQVSVEQLGIDLTLSVCTRDGHRVAEVDRQNGSWGPETISLIVPSDGQYLLQIRPVEKGAAGRYRIKINELRKVRPLDDVRVNAERIVTEGGKYYAKGKPDCLRESARKYEQALRLWQSLGDDYEVAVTFYGLGWSYSDLGSYGAVKFPEPRYRLRWSYESREDHLTALGYFRQALDIMRALGNRHGQAITLAGRAWPNLYLGRTEDGLKDFDQARKLFNSLGNKRGEAIAEYGLGWAYVLLNDNDKALNNFQNALILRQEAKDQRGEANTLAALSRVYSRLNRNAEALVYGQRALGLYANLKDTHGQASTLTILGWIYRASGQQTEALKSFRAALELRDAADSTGRANDLYGVARVQSEQGDLTKAQMTMKETLDLIEPLRNKGGSSDLRTYYFANVQEYYEFYIDLLMRMYRLGIQGGSPEEALRIKERARARELLAVLAESDEGKVHEYDSALAAPLDAAGIQGLLDDDTLLLEYTLGEERSYLWLVSPKEVLSYELPGRAALEAKALQLYALLTERNQPGAQGVGREQKIERADGDAQKVAAELSGLLLGQAAPRLKGKRLVIVTQEALQLVPFGMLPLPEEHAGVTGPTKPLVADYEVVSLPSASVLAVLRTGRHGGATKTVAVLADPVFTRDDLRVQPTSSSTAVNARSASKNAARSNAVDFDEYAGEKLGREASYKNYKRLPGTRWEAQQIVALVDKQDGFAALDFSASRDTALSGILRDYHIVHFATHAFVDDSHPAYSKIVLSQVDERGRSIDGNLTLDDVYKMKLRADLVVLSACRTGLGANTKGEGMIGLTGGFMHAGVPRVLVSLWPVSDVATAEFMARFYRKVLGPQKLPPTSALREVQIELWKDGRLGSAYFWAPFVFQGEWRWEQNFQR